MHGQVKYIIVSLASIFSLSLFASTYTWKAGSGTFSVATNWDPEGVPGPEDDAVITNNTTDAFTVTVSTALDIGSLSVGGGEGAGYPTVTFNNGVTTNKVAGSVTVASNATLTHRLNNNGANQYKLCLKCGSMTIASGGKVTADLKGPYPKGGATCVTSPQTGKLVNHPSYGGVGGLKDSLNNMHCWGSIREPMDLGGAGGTSSGDSYKGGGAIYIESTGSLVHNGTITAIGGSGDYYTGTGGSIYLKVGSISGSGTIYAYARASKTAGGGGGRISIRQSVATSFDAFTGTYTGKIDAKGGFQGSKKYSGCGTIYLEHAGDTPGEGTLIIDNRTNSGLYDYRTAVVWDPLVVDRNLPFGSVIITNNASLRLINGATLRIKKRLCTKKGKLRCETGSTVIFEGTEDAYIDGTNTFYSLKCTTPGKTLYFGTGSANKTWISSGGSLTLSGDSENMIKLRSRTDGTQWQFNVGENAVVSVDHCDVKDSNETGMMVLDEDGVDSGNNSTGWSILAAAQPGDLATWTGVAGTSWGDAGNWSPMRTPNEDSCVLIPAGCGNWPVITTSVSVNSLTNEAGATLTLSGANLTVTNAFASLGTVAFGANDVLKFAGDGNQVVDLGNLSYSRITADKSGGSISFLRGFKAQHFLARARTPVSLSFAAGQTVEAGHISLFGLVGESGAYDHVLTVGSSGTWYLKVTGPQHVRGVVVSNCDASPGAAIKTGTFSTPVGDGNVNWDFSSSAAAEWIGGASGFLTTSCWADGIVPQAETQVCICPTQGTYTVSTSAATATGSIVIGGDGGTVSFTSNYKHNIAGGLYILSGATCSFGYYSQVNEVAGDFLLGRGGVLTHGRTASGSSELYKLNFTVGGDATFEAGSTVNIQYTGFGGNATSPGRTSAAANTTSSYAGIGSCGGAPYGSILHPFSLGARGYESNSDYAYGGGAIKLIAAGDVVINGTINAGPERTNGYSPGTGGSVWISGSSVKGSGTISVKSTTSAGGQVNASGGRVAIYQTESIGWNDFSVTVNRQGYAGGTYYREDGAGNGELFVGQATNAGQVWVPMNADTLADYKKVSLTVSGGNSVAITNSAWRAGSTLVLRDVNLTASNAGVYLKSSRVKVLSRDHKDGKGWTGGDYAARTNAATISVRDAAANAPGAIIWPGGFAVSVR